MPDESPADLLRGAMDAQGIADNELRAGIAAIAGGESAFKPVPEVGYRHTSNARIRDIFGAAKSMSDAELNALKVNDAGFFEAMYGEGTRAGAQLGNTQPGDGFLYRGRGLLQLTGRANYVRYGRLTGHAELVDDPDLANEPHLAAAIAVAYMRDRYHGGGFEAMKRAVGNSFGSVDATKNALFEQYLADGTFAAGGGVGQPLAQPQQRLHKGDFGAAVIAAQQALIAAGFFCGPRGADGDFGNATEDAVEAFQGDRNLPVTGIVDDATRAALGLP
jgi:putative chitinase